MPSGSDLKRWTESQFTFLCHRDFWICSSILHSPRLSVEGRSCHFADLETEAQILYGFL